MSLEDSRSLVGIYHQLLTTGYSQSRYAKWYQATRFFPVVLVMKCDGQLEVVGCHSVTEPPFEEAWKQQPPPKKNLKAAEAVRKPIIGKRMQQFTKRNDVECLQATPSPGVKTRSLSGRAVGEAGFGKASDPFAIAVHLLSRYARSLCPSGQNLAICEEGCGGVQTSCDNGIYVILSPRPEAHFIRKQTLLVCIVFTCLDSRHLHLPRMHNVGSVGLCGREGKWKEEPHWNCGGYWELLWHLEAKPANQILSKS